MNNYEEFSNQNRLQYLLEKYEQDIEDGHSCTHLEQIRRKINTHVGLLQYEGLVTHHLFISAEEACFRYSQPIKNTDEVFSPARLFDLVWRYEDETENRYPYLHLEELRSKINLLPPKRY